MTTTIAQVGVVAHPKREEALPLADRVAKSLQARGLSVWQAVGWDGDARALLTAETDLVIAIGGDGAILRSVRACAPHAVPVMGVNLGYLGFLAEVHDPENWERYADCLMEGRYWLETRMMISADVVCDGEQIACGEALNDVVINRGGALGTVLLQTYIDRDWATTYHADALIIATATGSTAYGLAAGGPILPPELRNILIVPVAPHLSMDRPIVLSEGATVQVVVSAERENEVMLIVDGVAVRPLQANDCVMIRASDHVGRFLRTRERNYFYRSLLDRLEPRLPLRAAPAHLRFADEA